MKKIKVRVPHATKANGKKVTLKPGKSVIDIFKVDDSQTAEQWLTCFKQTLSAGTSGVPDYEENVVLALDGHTIAVVWPNHLTKEQCQALSAGLNGIAENGY